MQGIRALAELGITVYRRRSLAAPVAAHVAAPAVQASAPRPAPPAPRTSAPVADSVPAASVGQLSLALPGAQALPRLRAHLLQAWAASETDTGQADIVFGGRGRLLALPSLGALAGNPQLKRQAWQALRALRRTR
jgi:hypothetical protein